MDDRIIATYVMIMAIGFCWLISEALKTRKYLATLFEGQNKLLKARIKKLEREIGGGDG